MHPTTTHRSPGPAFMFLVGVAAGGAAAMLMSPMSGVRLRRKIQAEAGCATDAVKNSITNVVDKVADEGTALLSKARAAAHGWCEKASSKEEQARIEIDRTMNGIL